MKGSKVMEPDTIWRGIRLEEKMGGGMCVWGGGLNTAIIVWLDKSSDICVLCLFPTIDPDLNQDFPNFYKSHNIFNISKCSLSVRF